MVRIKSATFFFLLAYSVLASCMLDAEEENFIEIPNVPDPSYKASLHYTYNGRYYFPVKDTLYLEEAVFLRFVGGEAYGYEVLIDGKSFLKENSNEDFKIEKGDRPRGTYQLTLLQYAKSGTGSLGDKVGAESAVYKEDFILKVGPNTFKPEITSVVLKDGSLQLSWNTYVRSDFQAYEINKYTGIAGDPGTYDAPFRKLLVSEQGQTTLSDSTYVGGVVVYELVVKNGGADVSSGGRKVFFEYQPELELTKASENKLILSWTKPPFYNNIKHYSVSEGSQLIQDNIDPESFSVEMEGSLVFGETRTYSLRLNAKVEEYATWGADKDYYDASLTIGERVPPFHDILYNKAENAFYLLCKSRYYSSFSEGIYKVDGSTLEIVDFLAYNFGGYSSFNFVSSPDGQQLFLLFGHRIMKLATHAPLAIEEDFSSDKYFNSYTLKDNFSVSNNGLLLSLDYYNQVRIMDFGNKNVLLTTEGAAATHLSPDGRYFINGNELYSFNGSEFIKKGMLPYSEIHYASILTNEGKVLIATADKVVLFNFLSNTEISSFDYVPSAYDYIHLDQTSMILGTVNNSGRHFINVETGVTQDIKTYGSKHYVLEGSVLFMDEGFGLMDY